MRVILKYIPKNTTYRQIIHFLKPALEGGLFSKFGKIQRVLVLVHKHRLSQSIDFHAILDIQPDEAAKRVINKLHKKPLNGHCIEVTEYIERSIYNSNNSYTRNKYPDLDRRDVTKRFRLITIDQLNDFVWTENVEA